MADVLSFRRCRIGLLLVIALLVLGTAPVLEAEAQTRTAQHVVRSGDTLLALAIQYGTTAEALMAANNLENANLLYVGQILQIPADQPAASPVPPAATGQRTYTYTVKRGDNLFRIALSHNIPLNSLTAANGITVQAPIHVGQVLIIPGSGGGEAAPVPAPAPAPIPAPSRATQTYTVQRGDGLLGIALAYGVTLDSLMAANGIGNANLIRVGQVLVIPAGGTPPRVGGGGAAPPAPVVADTSIPAVSSNAFTATFYNSPQLTSPAVLRRVDPAPLDYDWGLGSPAAAVNSDRFSASFVGEFPFEEGTYRFVTVVDDGMRLFVDGTLIKSAWQVQAATTYSADVPLTAGTHQVRLEYFDNAQNASLALRWHRVDPGQPAVTPAPTPPPAPPPAPAPAPPAPSSASLDFAYGIQAHSLGRGNVLPVMRHINDMGFGWLKQQVRWEQMEPSRGNRQWHELDELIAVAARSNVQVLFSVVAAPSWARESGADLSVTGPPANYNDFASYIGDLAGRYCGGALRAIEVWNEQNLHYEWGNRPLNAAEYVAMLRVASGAIRQACPSMLIISGGLTPTADNHTPQSRGGTTAVDDFTYLRQMLAAGMANYVDGIGSHPSGYNVPPDKTWQEACAAIRVSGNSFNGACDTPHHSWSFRSTMEGYRAEAVARGAGHLKIVPTEFGWAAGGKYHPSYGFADDNSYREQADWTVEAYRMMQNWGWVGPAILWNLNFRVVADRTEKAQWGIVTPDWSPLPAYTALKQLAQR